MKSEYYKTDRMIDELRWGAKKRLKVSDEGLAELLGVSAGLIRNRSSQGKLPELKFWIVAQMAKANGKKIIFVDDERG